MEYNFKQIILAYKFKSIVSGNFMIITQFHFLKFTFFKPKISSYVNCLCLNTNTLISANDLFDICSFFEKDEKEFEDVSEIEFDDFISSDSIYNYSINLISFSKISSLPDYEDIDYPYFREFQSFISSFKNVFLPNKFFYYHFDNSFSLMLNSSSKAFDIIDFNNNSHKLRFNTPECYFESPSFEPCKAVLFSFNPLLFYLNLVNIDHPQNLAFNYKFIVPGYISETLLTKIFSKLPNHSESPYYFLCSSINDSLIFLKYLCSYITFFKGKTIRINLIEDFFYLEVILGLNESPSKTIEFFGDIQSTISKDNIPKLISSNYPFKTSNFTTPFFKIYSCSFPLSFSIIKSCFDVICSKYSINFNLKYIVI